MRKDQSAFPTNPARATIYAGLTVREYFAIHGPEPTLAAIEQRVLLERMANPNNESHKPKLHSHEELRCILRYEFADKMIAMSSVRATE